MSVAPHRWFGLGAFSILVALVGSPEAAGAGRAQGVGQTTPGLPTPGRLPSFFLPNSGQADRRVLFQASIPGGTAFFGASEIVFATFDTSAGSAGPAGGASLEVARRPSSPARASRTMTVHRLRLDGANPAPAVVGVGRMPGVVNVFHGSDPARWRTRLPVYSAILYRDLYPGIDLDVTSAAGTIEASFRIAPGADASRIRWRSSGAEANDLRFTGRDGRAGFSFRPSVFAARASDAGALSYSTYLGGGGIDIGYGVAVDTSGSIYVTGNTTSVDFPTADPIDATCGSDGACDGGKTDVFVAKLDPTQTGAAQLVYATYLGGPGDDVGVSIAVDTAGIAYVAGIARAGFPTTANAYQQTFGSAPDAGADAFLSKLSGDGSALLYSTYLGGASGDGAWGVAIDGTGAAWLTGQTLSGDFPVTAGVYKTSCGSDGNCDGEGDAFVAKLDTAASGAASLVFSTFLGGSLGDQGFGIVLGPSKTVFVTGRTASTDFPTVSPYQANNGGSYDAFVSKLSADGANLTSSTYLGGRGYDDGYTIAVDATGDVNLTGTTGSTDFPTTANAFQPLFGGTLDSYFTRLDVAGSGNLVYSTYIGGSGDDEGYGLALDGSGKAFLTGFTASSDFPATTCPFQGSSGGGYDAFVLEIDPSSSGPGSLISSGFFGGGSTDAGYSLALDGEGNVVFSGQTSSTDMPTRNPYDGSLNGNTNAFAARLSIGGCPATSFFTVAPCRAVDTRNAEGPYGGPALFAGGVRIFALAGQCGVPETAKAVSLNVTVTAASAAGDLRLYPAGTLLPMVSTINYRMGQTRANNATTALGGGGGVAVTCDQSSGTVQVIIDVNGYFE